uniref:SET domain containing 2, histone lysine methyltransferase n=1 Tax=Oncorhynchus kisutch TaxID=8019 RepID=A0A8C7IR29_ONCKI
DKDPKHTAKTTQECLRDNSSRCLNEGYCSNRRFQMKLHADFEVILTEDKGWGLRAARDLIPNTFVLEYCGEVLDHKEFKTRVKKYASMKNIHYYFMALKNNEIIDATLKGNCSRFMNHSCEPNCETQKWTVNGQLRVGFFTSKTVTAGTELTFDYQFQRYGLVKEAQKCFCGAPSCRGFLGGENRVSVRAAAGKMKKERPRKKDTSELEALLENGEGLYDEKEVVSLCRLMVRVETMEQKLICLKLIQDTQSPSCLKQFLDHHGLSLLWIFMVELSEAKGNSVNNIKLQFQIMKTLSALPISTKNMLEESHVLSLIQRWAQTHSLPQAPGAEQDGYSSENMSRAQTPLNTPDGSSASVAKLGPELDSDTPKRAVYRRLKISENSLDSAMSDASKASDGKEEEEEDEEEMEDEEVSQEHPGQVAPEGPLEVAPGTEDAAQVVTPASEAPPPPSPVVPVEPAAVGTPSQDEEEGVSDVESERSQEALLSAVDIGDMAARLLDSWKDLKARTNTDQ